MNKTHPMNQKCLVVTLKPTGPIIATIHNKTVETIAKTHPIILAGIFSSLG